MQTVINGLRHFNVHGIISKNADFTVYQDDIVSPSNGKTFDHFYPKIGPVLYTISVSTNYFGYIPIKIIVNSGVLRLTQSRAIYPGKFYNCDGQMNWGTYYQFQPYDPKFLVRVNGEFFKKPEEDKHLTGEYGYTLRAGDVFEYYHLIYSAYADFISLVYNSSSLPDKIDLSDELIKEVLDLTPTQKMDYLKKELLDHHASVDNIDPEQFIDMYLSTAHGTIQQNKNIDQLSP
jgi:hypothetical protein